MTHEIRFGWLGEARRAALRTSIAAEVMDWSRAWWMHHAPGEIDVRSIEPDSLYSRAAMPLVSANDAGVLVLHLNGKATEAIGRHLAGAASDEDAGLAERIGQDALDDLVLRIRRKAGAMKIAALCPDVAPLALEHARVGAYAVVLLLGRMELGLVIDRRLADGLAPPSAVKGLNLLPRPAAIGHAELTVTAVMNFGSIDLAHLSDLCVGEVLVGDRKLEDTLHIYVDGHIAVANGHLRRQGTKRAVMFDGVSSQDMQKP
jgi:hypothetical protein